MDLYLQEQWLFSVYVLNIQHNISQGRCYGTVPWKKINDTIYYERKNYKASTKLWTHKTNDIYLLLIFLLRSSNWEVLISLWPVINILVWARRQLSICSELSMKFLRFFLKYNNTVIYYSLNFPSFSTPLLGII